MRRELLYEVPRITGLAMGLILSLDALLGYTPASEMVGPSAARLIPTALFFSVLAIAWRREALGGLLFVVMGFATALSTDSQDRDWIMDVSGVAWLVGAGFLVSRGLVGRP